MQEVVYVKVGTPLRERIKELNDTELRVLLILGLRIDAERKCWPAVSVLAEECRKSERMIQYAVNKLVSKGFINIGRRVGGRGRTNIYTLNGYFAYGSETVQLIAPFATENGAIIQDTPGATQASGKGETTKTTEKQKKGAISNKKGAITPKEKGAITHACPDTEEEPLRRTNIRRTNIYTLFEHWNNQNVIVHRKLTEKVKRAISGALRDYSEEEIRQAISNYTLILEGPEYYFKHRWTLTDFLHRGLEKFLDLEKAKANYLRRGHDERFGAGGRYPERGGIPQIPSAAELADDWGAETDDNPGVLDLQGGGLPEEKPGPGPP